MKRVLARLLAAIVAASAATLLITAGPASAHEHRLVAGKYTFTVGWGDEPTYTGFKNSVSLALADAADKPITDVTDTVKVQVKSGDKTVDMTMEPNFKVGVYGDPGDYRAFIIPTRAGTYSFHFTGTIHGDAIDETFTSSETTFDSPKEASDVEFPAKDPSAGQLSQRIDRESSRVQALQPAVSSAKDKASSAGTLGIIGIVVGALGLAVGGISLARKK
jgi:hypothetical protein